MQASWTSVRRRSHHSGYSILEVLVAVSILAILAAIAVPSFRDIMMDNARASTVNDLVGALTQARNEAQRNGRLVVVCPLDTGNPGTCSPGVNNWTNGWLVYINMDNGAAALDAGDRIVTRYPKAGSGVDVVGDVAQIAFRPSPARAINGTVTFCDSRGEDQARQVVVAPSGKIRTAEGAPACP